MKHQKPKRNKGGMTLIEVLIAMGVVSLVCGGIYSAGIAIQRLAQTNRITAEAQAFAREGMEEIIARGYGFLAGGGGQEGTLISNAGHHHVDLLRTVDVIWHGADRSINSTPLLTEGSYAEVHVDVRYQVPGTPRFSTTRFSGILSYE